LISDLCDTRRRRSPKDAAESPRRFFRKSPRYNAERGSSLWDANVSPGGSNDQQNAEHVRERASSFRSLPACIISGAIAVLLEAGALLHERVHGGHRGHHKHGEYLALNGDIGARRRNRAIVRRSCAIISKSEPAGHHARILR